MQNSIHLKPENFLGAFNNLKKEIELVASFNKTTRKWHMALYATICVGTPLLVGLYFDDLKHGLVASMAGLVSLYLPLTGSLTNRLITILLSSFGFMISYTYGLFFSFNPIVSCVALGLFAFVVHWIVLYYKTSPPRSFFFVLIASIAMCQPYNLNLIPQKIGLIGLGSMFACLLAVVYIFRLSFSSEFKKDEKATSVLKINPYADFWEAIILGIFIFISLAIGKIAELDNPYWIPISCAAVMQGASLKNIWQRSFQRIIGTFIGLGLCWLILQYLHTPLSICIAIIVFQFIVEMLIARQYGLAVIFITPMTILMAEASNPLMQDPSKLIELRFWEIFIGSILGAFGGWILYKEKIRYKSIKELKKARIKFRK